MKYFLTFIAIVALNILQLNAQCTGTDVGGKVFIDIPANGNTANTYGFKDTNEQGLVGVVVAVTDDDGVVQMTTTDINGDWDVSSPVFPVRVEFSWSQTWLKESPFGVSENSSLRMVLSNDCSVNLGLFSPNEYTRNVTPDWVSHVRIAGSSIGNNLPSLQTVHYTDSQLSSDFEDYDGVAGEGPPASIDATVAQLGSTWGKTFQTSRQRMFVASTLWRHVGFASGKGLGDLFLFDYSSGSPATMLGSIDLQGVSPSNGGVPIDFGSVCRGGGCENNAGNTGVLADYELPDDPAESSVDLDAFAKAAKMGYGALDYDANTEKIWAINLNQKSILEIDVDGDFANLPISVNQYLMADLANVPSCSGGELRPWAITVHNGKGYVGCLCDGLSSQDVSDMDAYVVSFDLDNPSAGFSPVFSLALDYDKDGVDWNPWSDVDLSTGSNWTKYAQPILSAIVFDELGNMYLSFMDRWGLQAGYNTYHPESGDTDDSEKAQCDGELFKVCNTAGVYELEGTGSCPTNYDDEFFNDKAGDNHSEGANGALALVIGSNQLLVQLVDPHPEGSTGQDYWSTQGVNTLSTDDGSIENWYSNIYSGEVGYNGKGIGMGDVELLMDVAPVEVGNLVWEDMNGNGVQDAGESGIGNIVVDLLDASSAVLAQATTDANGYYIFSSNPSGVTTASQVYNIAGLSFDKTYTLRVADAAGGGQQGNLLGLQLSQTDAGSGGNANIHDSDATLSGADALIVIAAGELPSIGTHNHSFDFGFKALSFDWGDLPDLAAGTGVGDYESLDANNGPRHIINPNIFLGGTNTDEADALQNGNADGDSDDGLTLTGNENWTPGQTLTIPFFTTNTTGSTAQLEAWIDWNGDGDFADSNEMVADIDDAGAFPAGLTITVPNFAVQNQKIGFRVRLSTTNDMTPYGEAGDGEVEDYFIEVQCGNPKCLPTSIIKH